MSGQISLSAAEQELRSILLDVAEYIGSRNGHGKPELRFAGGWVRDKLLGVTSHDIDVGISSLTGEKFGMMMQQYFQDPETRRLHPKRSIGTLSVIKENPDKSKHLGTARTKVCGIEIDLVNLRKETYSGDSRNPTVEFGTPEEDALRRDATVNAMFYNLSSGLVEDPTGQGLRDLDLRLIRTPMDPFQTFMDDPLRVLRCIRFASRLGYTIDLEASRCMSHPAILDALSSKISRERVGDEVSKMLKGPDPLQALSLIDSLGLFDIIFTSPSRPPTEKTDVSHWHSAYRSICKIVKGDEPQTSSIRSLLLIGEADIYLGWLLAAVVPLAALPGTAGGNHSGSILSGPAVTVRDGLKLDNATTHIINDAFEHLDAVISAKNNFLKTCPAPQVPQKRPFTKDMSIREETGLAIRRWSPRKNSKWKLSVLFALLTEQARATERNSLPTGEGICDNASVCKTDREIIDDYVKWLQFVKSMGLLDVHNLAPILNGKNVMKAVGKKGGPWLGEALADVVRWQLRNPDSEDTDAAIKFVVERYQT